MKSRTLFLSATFLSLTSFCQGAITWQTPRDITDESDVSTNGTLVRAYTFTNLYVGTTTSVGGVDFLRTTSPTVADAHSIVAMGRSAGVSFELSAAETDAASQAYNNTTAAYKAILNQAVRATGGTAGAPDPNSPTDDYFNAFRFTLNGLISGNTYEVQIWVSDSRNATPAYAGVGRLDGTLNVDYNVGNQTGGLGQYVIGTFKANGTSEEFIFDSFPSPSASVALLNAYQVRLIPEPSAALLSAAGFFAAICRRRRG
jgi:hypothetical protein